MSPIGRPFGLFTAAGGLVVARPSPERYEEVGRAHVIEPPGTDAGRKGVRTRPAFANRTANVSNDKEAIAVSLAGE